MTKYICDDCGKEMKEGEWFKVTVDAYAILNCLQIEICQECFKKLKEKYSRQH